MIGRCGGVPVAVMKGRVHYYEGYTLDAGRLPGARPGPARREDARRHERGRRRQPSFAPGDLMVIEDHINLLGNPLVGPNEEALGARFLDMSEAYDRGLRDVAEAACRASGVRAQRGVYLALTGPSLRDAGRDPHVPHARRRRGRHVHGARGDRRAAHGHARASGISCITNMAAGVLDQKLDHREVLETGERVKTALIEVLGRIVADAARPA